MMIDVLRILGTVLIFVGGTLGISLFWPKITPQKPPTPIEQIREIIGKTEIGGKIVVEDKEAPTPSPATQVTTETVEEKITKVVTEKTTQEIEKTLKTLSPEQLEAVRKIICKPE